MTTRSSSLFCIVFLSACAREGLVSDLADSGAGTAPRRGPSSTSPTQPGPEAGVPGPEAGQVADLAPGPEAGLEAGPEPGPEVGREAGPEPGPEAGREAGPEPGPEAGREAGPEPGPEAGPEAHPCDPSCLVGCNVGCSPTGACLSCGTCSCDGTTGQCHC
jgi:hypothetical protein